MTDINSRAALEKERDRLQRRLEQIHADYRRGLEADSKEQAIQLENADTLAEIERVTAQQLDEVRAKLSALSSQTLGN